MKITNSKILANENHNYQIKQILINRYKSTFKNKHDSTKLEKYLCVKNIDSIVFFW